MHRQDAFGTQLGEAGAGHDAGRDLRERDTDGLGHERNGARGTRVGLDAVQLLVTHSELDVHQADDAQSARDASGDLDDLTLERARQRDRWHGAGGVARVHAGLLDVLEDASDEQFLAIEHDVDVDLDGRFEEAVDEDRLVPRRSQRRTDLTCERRRVVDDAHRTAAEHERGPHEHRIADAPGDLVSLLRSSRGPAGRHARTDALHHRSEQSAVLRGVDRVGRGAPDRYARVGQASRELERSLSTELHDDPDGAFTVDDLEHVLERQRLEIQPVGRVVVRGDGLGVAVDHDGLVPSILEREHGMDAAVVELDALTDAVRTRPEHDDGRPVVRRDLVVLVVGRIVVGRRGVELGRARVDGAVDGPDTEPVACSAHSGLVRADEQGDQAVPDPLTLRRSQSGLVIEQGQPGARDAGMEVGELLHLVDEPRVVRRESGHLLHSHAPRERLRDPVDAPRRGTHEVRSQRRVIAAVVGRVEADRAVLEAAHRTVERVAERAAERHDLAHRVHAGGERVVRAGELLEVEAGDLHDDVVDRRLEGRTRPTRDVVGDLIERVAERKTCRDLRDRETRRLGRERGRTGHAWVHLDDDLTAADGVDGELHVRSARLHPDAAQDGERCVTHLLQLGVGQRHCRCDGDGITRVHAHRVHVLDRAHDDAVVVAIAHDLELELLPADHGLLDEHLVDRRVREASRDLGDQLRLVIRDAAALAAERERGAQYERVAELGRRGQRLVDGAHGDRARCLEADLGHGEPEQFTVLCGTDALDLCAEQLDAELLEHAGLGERDREVERGLATERREQRIRPLELDDGAHRLDGQRLDVGRVSDPRIRHDRRRVGVHEDDPQPLLAQHVAGLRSRVIELPRLADDDRAGTEHEHAREIVATRHQATPAFDSRSTSDLARPSRTASISSPKRSKR